jgi:hypothetical protein
VIGVIAAIVLGVIPLVRDRNKASAAYVPPPTTSGAPQPVPTVTTRPPAYAPEPRRRIGFRGTFWALLPFVAVLSALTIYVYLKGRGFQGPLAWLGILALFLFPAPYLLAGIRLRNIKLVLTGAVYGLVSLILWVILVVKDHEYWTGGYSESSLHSSVGLFFSLFALGLVATIHAFWLRRRVFARPA